MSPKPKLRLVKSEPEDLPLSKDEAQLFNEIVDAWYNRRCGAKRQSEKSFNRDVSVVRDMVRFTSKAPWRWTPDEFDKWCVSLVKARNVAMSTERGYQTAIRTFLDYATTNVRFKTEVFERFGVPFLQICNDDNCIPHCDERELDDDRHALTHSQVELFFSTLDKQIIEAQRFGSKSLFPLQRDKVFFYLLYVVGLRISEAIGLNVNSFLPNAEFPEFGDFGRVNVWGKGSRGSGPRNAILVIDLPALPKLLSWYASEIRPIALRRADPNEEAFFLSERGGRVRISGMEARFQVILKMCGLDGQGFTPHCLRHSSGTHTSMWLSPENAQAKLRHKYMSTTQIYTHLPNPFLQEQMKRATRALIKKGAAEPTEGDNENGKP